MRRSVTFAIGVFVLLLASFTFAQPPASTSVPNLVRYGGVAKVPSGSANRPATTLGITFAIYRQQDGGAPVWQETQNVSPDTTGHYSVLLGSTTAAGLPGDLFSLQEERWLGVQVQGQPEQSRVLLVSVPYAMKAAEADRLAGHGASEFVTTDSLRSVVKEQLRQDLTESLTPTFARQTEKKAQLGEPPATTNPATNFVASTSDQVVYVQQNTTGVGLSAYAPRNSAIVGATNERIPTGVFAGVEGVSSLDGSFGVYGAATSKSASNPGIGIYGQSNSPNGIGLQGIALGTGNTIGLIGQASSTAGFAIDATETATSGNTAGMVAQIWSPAGIGALIKNNASGTITGALISARTSKGVQFTVDGTGNVNTAGVYTGNGTGLTGIRFSQLVGQLPSAQFSGSYGQTVTLSSASNVFYGDGSHLTGVIAAGGSPYYIQNGTAQQSNANFNISGNGTLGGTLSAKTVSTNSNYDIAGDSVLSIGSLADHSVFLGVGAGTNCCNGGGGENTFSGYNAGNSNIFGCFDTFVGAEAGYSNTGRDPIHGCGGLNSYYGAFAGHSNTLGEENTFVGASAGANSDYGQAAGQPGSLNTFVGAEAGYSTTTGFRNTFIGAEAGRNNTTGSSDIYIGSAGASGTEGYTIRIGFPYQDEGCPNPDTMVSYPCGQSAAYIAGIWGSTVQNGGIAVYVDSNGQLGTVLSSRRFKEQVHDMGDSTNALMKLRPVTFLYKPEYDKGTRTLQYGLIAEEVAEVYPDLVAYEPDGKPYTVKYQYLTTMLLNELQKEHHTVEELKKQNEALEQRLSRLEAMMATQVNTSVSKVPQATVVGAGGLQ
jgi:hypothetical protein